MNEMNIRVGVVGPEDSLIEMMKVGQHFPDLHLIPFVYEKTEETEDIIANNSTSVDQWFFSGQSPYYYALNKGLITEDNASYIPLHGSSFLTTLLEAFLQEGKIHSNISLDTIQVNEIDQSMPSLLNNGLTIQCHSYDGYIPSDDIIEFHQRLYEQGKSEIAFTCIRSVYNELKALQIPVYRVIQREYATHQALEQVREKGQVSLYKKSQLVILGIEVMHTTRLQDNYYSFKLKHQELELKRVLLDFTENINGSIVKIGDDLHFIYTTRGELEYFQANRSLHEVMKEINVNSNLQTRIGVGYGITVLEAEQNVRMAFDHARTYDEAVVIEVTEEKEVLVSLNPTDQLSFQTQSVGDMWENHIKDAHISSSVVSKIMSLANHYNKETLTSQDLSRWLKSTERNARRILSELEKANLAVVTGEESGQRGRPRKIYKLMFNN